MFSRLFTMLLFTGTVLMATFGQDVFGREHLIEMKENVRPVVVQQSAGLKYEATKLIKQESARFFADLAPSAGEENVNESEEYTFTFVLIDSLTPENEVSFITDRNAKKNDQS